MSAEIVTWPTAKTGTGPYVFYLDYSGPEVAKFTHDGESNIIIRAESGNGSDGLVNEIGPYAGEVVLPEGPSFITVEADGNWSVGPP